MAVRVEASAWLGQDFDGKWQPRCRAASTCEYAGAPARRMNAYGIPTAYVYKDIVAALNEIGLIIYLHSPMLYFTG